MFPLKKDPILHIGIVGLGLIGGSMAKALKKFTSHIVHGCDADETVVREALANGFIDEQVYDGDLQECDIVFLALYPRQTVAFMQAHARDCKDGCILVDFCGIKGYVVRELTPLCQENNICYIGGHPMAGKEKWGFAFSAPDLFANASMILTPGEGTPQQALDLLTILFADVGFGTINCTTPQAHDSMIAFTSQLAHVVSSAYIKSPRAREHHGFSAGSYRDLTRVAKLNPEMWTELFLENREALLEEIDTMAANLAEYRGAIDAGDRDKLYGLLDEGRKIKEELDNENNTDTDRKPLFHLR